MSSSPQTFDHPPEWPVYDEPTKRKAKELIERNRVFDYARGPEVSNLEDEFAVRHEGLRALTFNSGTSALYAAYRALGFSHGVEVIVPTFTFLSTASPLLALGAVPVFCDVRLEDGTVGVEQIQQRLSPKTKGVVVTHLFGNPCDMTAISAFCRSRGLDLVEDCSHAHASKYDGRPLGIYGDAAVYSLGAQKMVTGGHGGVLLTRSQDVYDVACLVGHFKHRSRLSVLDSDLKVFEDFGLGGNLRISPIAAVLANGLLENLEAISSDKVRLSSRLLAASEKTLGLRRLLPVAKGENRTFYDVVAMLPRGATRADRDRLLNALQSQGLRVRAPATRLLHQTSIITEGEQHIARLNLATEAVRRMRERARECSFACAQDLYDRLVSFPSACLYGANDYLVYEYETAMRRAASFGARP